MEKIPKEKSAGIGLCHASADDGANVLPETVQDPSGVSGNQAV